MFSQRDNLDRLRQIADEHGWAFNSDCPWVKRMAGKMAESLDRYGDYYCPLKQVGDPPMAGIDVLCPCPEAAHEIAEYGHCFCRLFYAIDVSSPLKLASPRRSRMPLVFS